MSHARTVCAPWLSICVVACVGHAQSWRPEILPVTGAAAVTDLARGVVVLFGGSSGSQEALGSTLEYDGARWRGVGTQSRPLPRTFHAMAYDVARNRVVLFGGLLSFAVS